MTIVKVIGAEALVARLIAKGIAGEVALSTAQDLIGDAVMNEAKRLVPVSTEEHPHLRDSITYDPEAKKVYTDVVYAKIIEYGGTHNDTPDPYMRPAADTVDDTQALLAAKAVIDSA
jgi:hypothetical protein